MRSSATRTQQRASYPKRSRLERRKKWSKALAPHLVVLGVLGVFAGGGSTLADLDSRYQIWSYIAGGVLITLGLGGFRMERYFADQITRIYETLDESQAAVVIAIKRVRAKGYNLAGQMITVDLEVPAGKSLSVGETVYPKSPLS